MKQNLDDVLEMFTILENGEYRMEHTAPTSDDDSLDNLSTTFGEDIYGPNAEKYFSTGFYAMDIESIAIIKKYKNRPNASVRIYRAVPDLNVELKKERKEYSDLLGYFAKFNFFPVNSPIINNIENEYYNESLDQYEKNGKVLSYDELNNTVIEILKNKYDEIQAKFNKSASKIYPGDWVTINKNYAIMHGKDNLDNKYKVLSKAVLAKEINTDGNSIHEWGYNPVSKSLNESIEENDDMIFWHGGNLEKSGEITRKKGRFEYGPGLYATKSWDVVNNYTKGSRKLYRIIVTQGTDLSTVNIQLDDVIEFIKNYVIPSKKKDVLKRVQSRASKNQLPATSFQAIIINNDAIMPKNMEPWRLFLVNHGIDYEIIKNYAGSGLDAIVIFNNEKIKSTDRITPNTVTKFDL